MASKATGWLCTHAVTTADNSDPNKINVTVTCYWKNNGWNYDINNVSAWVYCGSQSYQVKNAGSINSTSGNYVSVSCGSHTFVVNKSTSAQSISCYAKITSASSYVSGTKTSTATSVTVPAKTSYKVTFNANGGSGAPAAQTKWYGTNLTLSSTVPTRSGYSFQGWGTSASTTTVSYEAGATYSANAAITLYAVWKAGAYTVTFNANGGSLGSVPSTMSKTHGTTLTLPTAKPTRTNYNFKGWGTSASATTVAYQPGGSYTTNAAITLYAIWEVGYTKPRITNLSIQRVNTNGVVDDGGTRLKVSFNWATDKSVTKVRIDGKKSSGTQWLGSTLSASGTSGSVNTMVASLGGEAFDPELSYQIMVEVADASGSSAIIETVSSMVLPIDVKAGAKGLGFGKTAELDDAAEFQYMIYAHNGIRYAVLPENTNFDNVKTPGAYPFGAASTYGYQNCPIGTATSGTLEVFDNGDGNQRLQRVTACSKSAIQVWERCGHDVSSPFWGQWVRCDMLSAITAFTKNAITKTTNGTGIYATGQTQIPLDGGKAMCPSAGCKLSLSGNAIVVGPGVQFVEVSASALITNNSGASGKAQNLIIKKNGSEYVVSMNSTWSTVKANATLVIPPNIFSVKEGDQITFHWHAAANDTLSNAAARTYITVKTLQ